MRPAWMVVGLVAAACGDDGSLPPGACEEGAFVGAWDGVRVTEDGTEVTPYDLSDATISATAGGRTYEGRGFLGGFRIDGLPAGPITLRIDEGGWTYGYLTRRCSWRSTSFRLGVDAPYPGPETSLAAEVTGLVPWSEGDQLEVFAARSWSRHDFSIDPAVDDGATSLISGKTYGATMPLVDGGEPVRVFQSSRSAASPPDVGVRTLVASRDLTRFTMRDGEDNLLQATLLPLEDTEEISFAIDADAFHSLAPDDGAERTMSVGAQLYRTLPGVDLSGGGGAVEALIVGTGRTGVITLDRIAYADPFPPTWPRVSAVYATETVTPSTFTTSREIYTAFGSGAELEGALLTPVISPPRNVTIAGQAIAAVTEPVGETPVVAWDPPSLGEASSFAVWINTVDQYGRWDGYLGIIYVDDANEVTIPAGILVPGRRYELMVDARSGGARARAYGLEPFTP